MAMDNKKAREFIERRKQFRLPFENRVIFSDGKTSFTAYASNLSQGGLFVKSQSPLPIDVTGLINFRLPSEETSLCLKAKVAHIVFDRQRCEVDNGMGIQFLEMTDAQKKILNDHMSMDQHAYLELQKILQADRPNASEIYTWIKKLPHLNHMDLLELRYKVNRICTIFQPAPVELLHAS